MNGTSPGKMLRPLFYAALLLSIVLSLGSGCSDPPDPVPLQKLSARASSADRFVVVASGDYADPNFKPVEIKGPGKAAQFLATLEFSSKRRFYHSPIHGEYSIQCFSNEQQLVAITIPGYRPAALAWEVPGSSKEGGVLKRSSLNTLLTWLATNGCDIAQREQASEEARKRAKTLAELNCVACFPPEVRDLIGPQPDGSYSPPWAVERGYKLAAAIHDPVRLTILTSKALACLGEFSYGELHEQILLAALTTVEAPALEAGLKAIEGDRAALVGASRFFFRSGPADKLPKPELGFWRAKLGEVVLNDGNEGRFPGILDILSNDPNPEVRSLLRKIARGQTGKAYEPRGMHKYEPLARPLAYLCLALQQDADVRSEIEDLLPTTTRPIDRASLELALALLAKNHRVRIEHFAYTYPLLSRAAVEAIAKHPDQQNLDTLVFGGLSFPDHYAQNMEEAAALFEQTVNHHWPVEARYNGEIRRWWQTNRTAFAR